MCLLTSVNGHEGCSTSVLLLASQFPSVCVLVWRCVYVCACALFGMSRCRNSTPNQTNIEKRSNPKKKKKKQEKNCKTLHKVWPLLPSLFIPFSVWRIRIHESPSLFCLCLCGSNRLDGGYILGPYNSLCFQVGRTSSYGLYEAEKKKKNNSKGELTERPLVE